MVCTDSKSYIGLRVSWTSFFALIWRKPSFEVFLLYAISIFFLLLMIVSLVIGTVSVNG